MTNSERKKRSDEDNKSSKYDKANVASRDTFVSRTMPSRFKILNHNTMSFPPAKKAIQIPKSAEYLLYLALPKKDREAVLADLEETFHIVCTKHSLRKARFAYWFQVMISVGPFMLAKLSKLAGLGLGTAVLTWIKSRFGSQ